MRIDNETWLLLTDGRLISIHRQIADGLVASGAAVHVPHERVVSNEAGTAFVLLPEPGPAVDEPTFPPPAAAPASTTAALTAPETAMRHAGRGRKAG